MVVFCSAVGFAAVPGTGEEATLFQAVEGGVERSFLDAEDFIGDLANAFCDSEAVVRPVRDGLQDHHVECSLKQLRGFVRGFAAGVIFILIGIHVFCFSVGG